MTTVTRAELHCYRCGYIAGSLEESRLNHHRVCRLIPPRWGPGFSRSTEYVPRCGRCGGPLYLEDSETVSVADQADPTLPIPVAADYRRTDAFAPPPKTRSKRRLAGVA